MRPNLRELTLEITRECMNRCMHCSSLAVTRSDVPAISHQTVSKLVAEAMSLGLHTLAISGGEPFLHPHIERILRASAVQQVPRLLVYTSGVYRDYAKSAVPLPIALIGLARSSRSVLVFNVQSAVPAIHDRIVGTEGRLEMTLEAIQRALSMGTPVECHIVPNHLNVETLALTARRLILLGVDRVSFLRLVPQGYALENRDDIICTEQDEQLMRQQFQELFKEADSRRCYRLGVPFSGYCGRPQRCRAGRSKLIMRWDGIFFPCEAFKGCDDERFGVGSAYETPLATALHRVRSCPELETLRSNAAQVDTCPAQRLYAGGIGHGASKR